MAPSEVRLHPLNSDRYRWHSKASKRYLFASQLSKLSTNAYIEIRKALASGDIWAVLEDGPRNVRHEIAPEYNPVLPPTQQQRIDLDTENQKLRVEIEKAMDGQMKLQGRNEQLEIVLRHQKETAERLHHTLLNTEKQAIGVIISLRQIRKVLEIYDKA